MFKSARIKLTLWYLLIIMTISLSFSGVIYLRVCRELERGFKRVELRHRAEELGISLPRFFSTRPEDLPRRLREIQPRYFFIEDLEEAKKRLALILLLVNGGILFFSAVAGWFLAGKTLKPIEDILEEQKRFIADASHELRTPLTALKTSLEVGLRDQKMNLSEAKKLIRDSLFEIDDLKSLTDKLLSLARYQSNGRNLTFQKVDIKWVVEKVLKKISPLVKDKGIKLTFKIQNQDLWANEESLEEMLLIFLDNAVKYTPKGGEVFLKIFKEGRWLKIQIRDTGVGIAKEDLPHIFDRFYRADQSRSKEKVSGFGLGLALAKKIIELHKGIVGVTSVLNRGTTFTINLPLKHS